jgi:hypothetical protein
METERKDNEERKAVQQVVNVLAPFGNEVRRQIIRTVITFL